MILRDNGDYDWRYLDISLMKLPHRERIIIRKNVFSNVSMANLDRKFRISRERVRQLRQKALSDLERLELLRLTLRYPPS